MRIFALALLFSLSVIAQVQVRYPQPYDEEILEIFNGERQLAGVVNLTWNAVLAADAQDYANRCNSSLSAVKTYGEFVIRGFGVSETDAPKLMAALLVGEGRDWNCTTDVCISGACTHHRQIIWESTTEIGCGFSHCGTKGYQLVCRFLKVGNTYNTHPLAKTGCPKAETHKRTFGYGGGGWGSGGLLAGCLSGWGNTGWGGSGWGDSSSGSSGWGSSGSSQPSGWGSSGASAQPSGWGGSSSGSSGWGSSSSSSGSGWNGNGGWGNSQGGFRLSQTNTDQTALTNNELWAFWYSQGRNVIVDAGFVSHTDGTVIPVPGGSLKVISWEDQVLEVHNAERASYGLNKLVWDTALASAAQDYSSNCDIKLSGVRGIGESIAIGSGPVDKANVPKLIAALWSSEVFDWNCTTDVCLSGMCSHHRQMIWDETTKVGCGFSSCGTEGHVLVCRYDSVGNLGNRHPLASLGESACFPKHNNTAGKRTFGGYGGGGGCGGLLASCLNGYGAFSSSGWGSSGSSSSGWGSSSGSSGWGSSGSSQPSGWGSSSGSSGWGSSGSSQPSGWGSSGSSSPSGWGSSSGSGWRVSESAASGTNSWGAALQSAASAVPSWWAQFQSAVTAATEAVEGLGNLTDGVNAAADAEAAASAGADAAQQGQDAGGDQAAAGGSKKRGYGSTSNPSGSWGSSNSWGGHDSSQTSCAAPTAGWSNQPSASSSSKGGWRCSAPSSSAWGGSSTPSSNAWGSAAASSGWSSASDSCTAVQNSNSGWPGGNAGWGNTGSSSWSSGSSGWRVQKVETSTNEVTDLPSNNPVFQWWSIDGRSIKVDPGFRSDSDGSIIVEGNGQPATGVEYIGALPKNTAIAVIVVCAVCGLLLIALIVVFLVKKRKAAVESF